MLIPLSRQLFEATGLICVSEPDFSRYLLVCGNHMLPDGLIPPPHDANRYLDVIKLTNRFQGCINNGVFHIFIAAAHAA